MSTPYQQFTDTGGHDGVGTGTSMQSAPPKPIVKPDALLPPTLSGMNNNDANAYMHLHRAEMGVMVAYR